MYLPIHLERHPFGRVPALQHDDFMLYETSAIAAYVDDVLPGPKFTPADPRQRARMNQWMCNLNSYFYPEMIYHVSHERMVYPELGIPGNDLIVQRAMPKVIHALQVMEKELSDGRPFIVGDAVTMAEFFLLPTLFGAADMHFIDDFCANGQSGCAGPTSSNWENFSHDPVDAVAVVPTIPEPASLALLGTALLGFATVARRRNRNRE
jgi:glutathione S-transferase